MKVPKRERILAAVIGCMLVLGLVSTGLAAPAAAKSHDQPPKPDRPLPCRGVLGCGEDLAAALDLEQKIRDNMWGGQVYEIDYATPERVPGDVASVNHFGDSALWTGTYLASQSFRYATAAHYLADKKVKKDERVFWEAQKADAKSRVDEMVAKFHMLSNISKNWTNTDDPTVSPPTVNLGGTVYQGGEAGYLMRACISTDTPEWQRWSNAEIATSKRIYGPLDWDDGKQYWCEDATSRDAYAGTTFGLLTAFDLVGGDDDAMRHQLRDDILTLVGFAVKYFWTTPRPNGRISIPVTSNRNSSPCKEINQVAETCGHDFENFISPLFNQVPMARLNMAHAAKHVSHADPGRDDVATWDGVWDDERRSQIPIVAFSEQVNAAQPNEGYYKYNLEYLTGYNVARVIAEGHDRNEVRRAFSVLDKTLADDANAHFETISYALTGEAPRLDLAVQHVREWRDWRARVDQGINPMNSTRCSPAAERPITCVLKQQLEVITPVADPTVTVPGYAFDPSKATVDCTVPSQAASNCRAARPLPVAERPGVDFLWQKPPTQLDGGEGPQHQEPGIDYLLPYWMLRYYSEASQPKGEAFPQYDGPAHA